jgi:hypothetical protein
MDVSYVMNIKEISLEFSMRGLCITVIYVATAKTADCTSWAQVLRKSSDHLKIVDSRKMIWG